MTTTRSKWSGTCSWCGKPGDTSSLFCYAMATGEYAEIARAATEKPPRKVESRYQFCSIDKFDCLDRWLASKGRPPYR